MVHPVGFGAYSVDEFKPDEYITFKKFDNYYGEKAPVDAIKYMVVPETAPRVMGLLSGDYDIITEIMPDQFSTIEKAKGYTVVGGPINNIRLIISENQDPPGTYLYLLPLFYGKSDKINWAPSGSHFMDFRAGNLEMVE